MSLVDSKGSKGLQDVNLFRKLEYVYAQRDVPERAYRRESRGKRIIC